MNTRISTALFATCFVLLGCSTPQPPMEQALTPPPPEIQRDLPLEQPPALAGRVCKLGDSCMELDPRPFEACLVGARHCADKAMAPIPANTPNAPEPEGSVAVSKRGNQ